MAVNEGAVEAPRGGWVGSSGRAVRRALAAVTQPVFGSWEWSAPPWLAWIGANGRRAATECAAHPRATAFGLVLIGLALAGGYAGWLWWEAQPKPVLTTFTVKEPGPMRLDEPDAKPEPLVIEFAASVAPLKDVGKDVTQGVALSPAIDGRWRWDDDKVLRFQPKAEWPVGTVFTLSLEKGVALAAPVRLADYRIRFKSAPFVGKIGDAKFYQDPVDSAAKKVIATVSFSHPVDVADFEKRITLRLAGRSEGVLGIGAQTTPFRVSYDKWKLNAFIHSEPLAIPAKPTAMEVTIADGARAAKGGPPIAAKLTQSVSIPGLYSLMVNSVAPTLVNNERFEPEQLIVVENSALVNEQEIAKSVSAWVLPLYHPSTKPEERKWRFNWEPEKSRIGSEILQQGEMLKLAQVPTERENAELHSFKFQAEPGRYVDVKFNKGMHVTPGRGPARPR